MLRSLWTAASGMKSQQLNVDTIANNLANINTTGYKSERVEFQSLLYQTIQGESYDREGDVKPIPAQVGLGVKSGAITSNFTQGSYSETGGAFDFALDGEGFLQVRMPNGTVGYTRNGALKMAIGTDGLTLSTSEGYPVLDVNGDPVTVSADLNSSRIIVDRYGNLSYKNLDNSIQDLGIQIERVQFNNPAGLTKASESIFTESAASGVPRYESADNTLKRTTMQQGYLEASNVSAADEMVNLIIAQRAYEMNSKAINASDEMLQQANNLRG